MPEAANKSAQTLPKMGEIGTRGVICQQWVRCGRPGCRCSQGELHGPYHYLFWREGGRLRKRYVRLADAAVARAACLEWRERARQERERARAWWREWRALRAGLREMLAHG